jgi:hypothetical protein
MERLQSRFLHNDSQTSPLTPSSDRLARQETPADIAHDRTLPRSGYFDECFLRGYRWVDFLMNSPPSE